jgi:hypothetical protein
VLLIVASVNFLLKLPLLVHVRVTVKWLRVLNRTNLVVGAIVMLTAVPNCTRAGDQSSTSDLGSRVPDWVLIYPGTTPEQMSSHDSGVEHYLNFVMKTHDSCHQVMDWYENKLHAAGYNTSRRFGWDMPTCGDGFQSDGPGRTRSINVHADENAGMGAVIISVQAVERNVGNRADASVPRWVPIYPGTKPGHMEARKSHDEYHLAFSFMSADDPNKVYSWYKAKLEALGFHVSFDVTPRSGGLVSNNSDNTRTLNMRNYPSVPENTFTVQLMDR